MEKRITVMLNEKDLSKLNRLRTRKMGDVTYMVQYSEVIRHLIRSAPLDN